MAKRASTHQMFITCSLILNRRMIQSIEQYQLWQIMHEYGFPDKLLQLINATMDRVMSLVRVSGTVSSPFESLRGLRQSDGLSCLLFNIALGGVIWRSGINTSVKIFTKFVKLLGFADDIEIITSEFETMAKTYIQLKHETRRPVHNIFWRRSSTASAWLLAKIVLYYPGWTVRTPRHVSLDMKKKRLGETRATNRVLKWYRLTDSQNWTRFHIPLA